MFFMTLKGSSLIPKKDVLSRIRGWVSEEVYNEVKSVIELKGGEG